MLGLHNVSLIWRDVLIRDEASSSFAPSSRDFCSEDLQTVLRTVETSCRLTGQDSSFGTLPLSMEGPIKSS